MPKLKLSHESDPQNIPDVVVSPLEFKPKRVFYGLIVGAVIITISVTGAFLLTDYFNPKATPVPPIEIKKATSSAKPATSNAQKADTVDWKKYTFDKVKISIEIPADWSILEKEEARYNGVDDNLANGLVISDGSKKIIEIYYSTKPIGYIDGPACSNEMIVIGSTVREFIGGFVAFEFKSGYYEVRIPFPKLAASKPVADQCNQSSYSIVEEDYQKLLPMLRSFFGSFKFLD